jgi:hypothetical protein
MKHAIKATPAWNADTQRTEEAVQDQMRELRREIKAGKTAGGEPLEFHEHGLGPGEGGGLRRDKRRRVAEERVRLAEQRPADEAARQAQALAHRRLQEERVERHHARLIEHRKHLMETGDLDPHGNLREKKYLLTVPTASVEAAAEIAAQLRDGRVPPLDVQDYGGRSNELYLPRRSYGEHLPAGWAGLALKITKEPLNSEVEKEAFERLAKLSTELGADGIGPRIFAHGVFDGSQSSLLDYKNRGWTLEQRYAADLFALLTLKDHKDPSGMKFASPSHETSLAQAAMEGALEQLLQVAKLGYLPGDVKPANLLARLIRDEDSPDRLEVRMTDFDPNLFVKWPGPAITNASKICHSEDNTFRALYTASAFVSAVLLHGALLATAKPDNLNGMAAQQLEKALGKPHLVPEVVGVLFADPVVQTNLTTYSRKGVSLGPAAAAAEQHLPFIPAIECSEVEISESIGTHRTYNKDRVGAAWKAASEAEAARKRRASIPTIAEFRRARDNRAHVAKARERSETMAHALKHARRERHHESLLRDQVVMQDAADRERAEQALYADLYAHMTRDMTRD